MRSIVTASVLAMMLSGAGWAAKVDCGSIGLSTAAGRTALVSRVATFDAQALLLAGSAFACFSADEADPLAHAAGVYFDARPHEFIEQVTSGGNAFGLLELITWLPAEPANPSFQFATMQSRARALDANRKFLTETLHAKIELIMKAHVSERVTDLTAAFHPPTTLWHPLLDLEIPLQGIFMPVPFNFLTIDNLIRGTGWRIIAQYRVPKTSKSFIVIAGHGFITEPGNSGPVGLKPDAGWIALVDEGEQREQIEFLGPANALFNHPQLSPEDVAGICASAVDNVKRMFLREEKLQAALDLRLAVQPGAEMPQPLGAALVVHGFDVSGFRMVR